MAIFLLVPISALIFNKISQSIERHSRQLREHLAVANSVSQDTIGGISIVKAFNLNELLSQKYKKVAEQVQNEGLYIDKVNSYLRFVELSLGFIPQLVYPLYGGYLTIQGELTVGSLLACGPLIWYIFLPAEAFLGFFRQMRETVPATERLVQILNKPTEHVGEQPFEIPPDAMPLEFSDVSFSYGGEKNVLNRLSFQLPTGKMVALVGPSGGGKSTVFKLICGYYYPQSGSIQLYDNNLNPSSLSAARAHVSLVSQDIYLFPTTIVKISLTAS